MSPDTDSEPAAPAVDAVEQDEQVAEVSEATDTGQAPEQDAGPAVEESDTGSAEVVADGSGEVATDDANEESTGASTPVTVVASRPIVLVAPDTSVRFQADLQSSSRWIDSRDDATGTLQIMLLSQDRFNENAYYDYIDKLDRQGVDISEVRVFQTWTGNRAVFSVVFGEYSSRGAAAAARGDLVAELRQADPVARSVGSLREEMQRLRERN